MSNLPADDPEYLALANAIAQQADAIARQQIPTGQLHAQARRLQENVLRLVAWTPDDRRP